MAQKIVFTVRFSPEIREAAKRAAADDHRPLSQWIEKLVAEKLTADGYLPAPKK